MKGLSILGIYLAVFGAFLLNFSFFPTTNYVWRGVGPQIQCYFCIFASFSLIVLFSGVALVGYGRKPHSESEVRVITKIGYVLAVLGGFIGLLIGLSHLNSTNQDEKYHGKVIVSIGTISTLAYVPLFLLQLGV